MARSKQVRYSPKIAAAICERIAGGESLRAVCREEGMPTFQSFLHWVADNRDGLRALYNVALDFRAQFLVYEVVDIADAVEIGKRTKAKSDGTVETLTGDMVERSKLKVEARKWAAARLSPKKYGDRLAQEISGPDGGPVEFDTRRPSPDEVAAFAREMHEGFQGWRDEGGEPAAFGSHQAGAFAEVIASYAAGQDNESTRTGREVGEFLAKMEQMTKRVRSQGAGSTKTGEDPAT